MKPKALLLALINLTVALQLGARSEKIYTIDFSEQELEVITRGFAVRGAYLQFCVNSVNDLNRLVIQQKDNREIYNYQIVQDWTYVFDLDGDEN